MSIRVSRQMPRDHMSDSLGKTLDLLAMISGEAYMSVPWAVVLVVLEGRGSTQFWRRMEKPKSQSF